VIALKLRYGLKQMRSSSSSSSFPHACAYLFLSRAPLSGLAVAVVLHGAYVRCAAPLPRPPSVCRPSHAPSAPACRRMARLLHALRIDNAHGTPLHVAASMSECGARGACTSQRP